MFKSTCQWGHSSVFIKLKWSGAWSFRLFISIHTRQNFRSIESFSSFCLCGPLEIYCILIRRLHTLSYILCFWKVRSSSVNRHYCIWIVFITQTKQFLIISLSISKVTKFHELSSCRNKCRQWLYLVMNMNIKLQSFKHNWQR